MQAVSQQHHGAEQDSAHDLDNHCDHSNPNDDEGTPLTDFWLVLTKYYDHAIAVLIDCSEKSSKLGTTAPLNHQTLATP
jgi:hypothetical protein|tara:strand:- start:352 stop:588 length:237 start_codon:yes stop_codon:yes gene_type:complete